MLERSPTSTHRSMQEKSCIELMGYLPARPCCGSSGWSPGQTGKIIPVKVHSIKSTGTAVIRHTRRHGGSTTATWAIPLRSRGRPRRPTRRSRTRRAVTHRSGARITRHTSSSGRRSRGSGSLRRLRRWPIGPLQVARRRTRGRRPTPWKLVRLSTGPIAGRATATPAGAWGLLTLLTAGWAGHSSGSRRRTTHTSKNRSRSTRCDCSTTRIRRAYLNHHSRYWSSHARNTANCSKGRGSRQVQKEPGEILHSRRKHRHSSSPRRRNYYSRRFRDSRSLGDSNRLHTLLLLTSGSPSSLLWSRTVRGGRRSSTGPRAVTRTTREIVWPRTVTATSPASRGSRTLLTGSVEVRRPRPVTSSVVSARPVSIRGSRPVSPRAIRRSRPLTARPLAGGQWPRRRPPPTLSTTQPRTISGARTMAMVTRAVRPRAGSTILPCSSIRRSGNTGGSRKGVVHRNFSRLITSRSVLRWAGRSNWGSGAGRGSPLGPSNLPLCSSRRSWRDRGALARNRRMSRDTSTPLARPRSSGRRGSLTGRNTRCTPRHPPLILPSWRAGRRRGGSPRLRKFRRSSRTVVEQRMTVEPWCWGGGGVVSHPLQLTTRLVVNSFVITSPTLAGESMLLILKVSILLEQISITVHFLKFILLLKQKLL